MKPEPFGNYTLLRPLGKGGMAEVFLARARSIGGFEKLVAIKRLLPPFNIDNQILSMLADEARLSVWLTHPNIVQVLDFGRVGKTYYIAMEYVEGCDLCDLIRPSGQTPGKPLPLPTALYVMVQVAEALDFAHRRRNERGEALGVIHRDVSPHNVLISTEGQVKLADFGLARASISVHHSHAGVIRGKFSYMPKEQAHGRDIDHRIDLFASGVTLYEALTGVKPYTSTTLAQQLFQLEQPVPPPSALLPDIPEEIDDLTLQAMSPDPGDRYQSAEDLATDLRNALLKVSTFAQEEKQLTALVKNSLAARGIKPPDPLPPMSLADIPVTTDNLIGEEVLILQQTQLPTATRTPSRPVLDEGPPTDEIPDLSDDDEEGDTSQFMQGSSQMRVPARVALPSTDSFDAQRTVALSGPQAAPSLPPAALDPDQEDLAPDTEAMDPALMPTSAAGELDSRGPGSRSRSRSARARMAEPPVVLTAEESFPSPAALGLVDAPHYPSSLPGSGPDDIPDADEQPVSEAGVPAYDLDSPEAYEPAPYDTLRDPERAGQLAQEALDYARTIQRSPEEALSAFRRALDEREKLRRQANRVNLRPVHWSGIVAGGVILLCAGAVAGWFAHAPDPPRPCPRPRPCPASAKAPAAVPLLAPAATPDAAPVDQGQVRPDAAAAADAASPDVAKQAPAAKTAKRPERKGRTGHSSSPTRPPHRPHSHARSDRPPAGTGWLVISADSPARALVDGRTLPLSLPAKVPLSPGIHAVRVQWLETDTFSATQWRSVKEGKTARIKFILEE